MAEIRNGNDGLEERNIIIIGGGTAGFAAGVYTSRAMLEPLLITGDALCGQLSLTLDLENYPGFFGTEAAEFITGMQKQAERFGTEVKFDMVTEVDFNRHPFYLKTYDGHWTSPAKKGTADAASPTAPPATDSFSRTNGSSLSVEATPPLRRGYS